MTSPASGLPDHLEQHLGEIEVGWQAGEADQHGSFRVLRFKGQVAGGVPFATLGLSRWPLVSATSGRELRQELIVLVAEKFAEFAAALLLQLGKEATSSGNAFLRGNLIGPRDSLFPNADKDTLYVALPVYLPDSFTSYSHENGYKVGFPWLVPITHREAHFVAEHGWSAFEGQLLVQDPDLVQCDRESIV